MKLAVTSENYAATVVKVGKEVPLAGMDATVGLYFFGYQVIVANGTVSEGEVGLLFTAETRLSPDFLKNNNLYRHGDMNADKEKSGYFEDSGRVKAIKIRGHISSAFFIPLSSLSYLGVDVSSLKVGDVFNSINGVEVCKKHVSQRSRSSGKASLPKQSFVSQRVFPEHHETSNYLKNSHRINDGDFVIVTQKLHGTSARFCNQVIERKLGLVERIAKFFGAKIQTKQFIEIAGARHTIRSGEFNGKMFYETNVWSDNLAKISGKIPKNWVVYGEIIGWDGDKPIQKNYTYDQPQGKNEFYVYRIAVVNEDGMVADLSWDAIVGWCQASGVKHVPELFRGRKFEFIPENWVDVRYRDQFSHAVGLSNSKLPDEGVCVRVEGFQPLILKHKSPEFLANETKAIDKGEVDIEAEESTEPVMS